MPGVTTSKKCPGPLFKILIILFNTSPGFFLATDSSADDSRRRKNWFVRSTRLQTKHYQMSTPATVKSSDGLACSNAGLDLPIERPMALRRESGCEEGNRPWVGPSLSEVAFWMDFELPLDSFDENPLNISCCISHVGGLKPTNTRVKKSRTGFPELSKSACSSRKYGGLGCTPSAAFMSSYGPTSYI